MRHKPKANAFFPKALPRLGIKLAVSSVALLTAALPVLAREAGETLPTDVSVTDYAFGLAMAQSTPTRQSATIGEDGLVEGAIYLEADEITTEPGDIFVAKGHVLMRNKTRLIRADEITYNGQTHETTARGHTETINDDGSVQFADLISYNDEIDQGVGENLASSGTDGAKIFARRIERVDENSNRLINVIYTPCKLCEKNGLTQEPSWSIEADQITQRKDKKMVYYRNAKLKLHGVPVFYTPYLWTPDPELERASGFLAPRVGLSDDRGFTYEQPYLWSLSPHDELIISPQLNTNINPLLSLSYARQFYSGRLNIRVGGTQEAFFDRLGDRYDDANFQSDKSERDWRYYVLADGYFKLNDDWHWSFTAQSVKDDFGNQSNANFFNRYDIEDSFPRVGEVQIENRTLVSQLNLARIVDNAYVSVTVADFQSLVVDSFLPLSNGTYRPIARDSDYLPTIAPMVEMHWSPKSDILGGVLTLSGQGIIVKHKLNPSNDVCPSFLHNPALNAQYCLSAYDTARFSALASWRGQYFTKGGLKFVPSLEVRSDTYRISDINPAGDAVTTSRQLGTASLMISYPMVKRFNSFNMILEPIAQVAVSPDYKADSYIPNEDSPSVDFDETKLFSTNRSAGYDLYESGTRLNVGVRAMWAFDDSSRISVTVGRAFRNEIDPQFTKDVGATERFDFSGFGAKESDWVISSDFRLKSGIYGYARTRLSSEDFRPKAGEYGLSVYQESTNLTVRYIFDDVLNNPIVSGGKIISIYGDPDLHYANGGAYGLYRNVQVYGRHFFNDHWGVSARLDYDALGDKFRRSTFGIIYRDDCSWYELVYQRNDTILNTVRDKPKGSWMFRLNLATNGMSRTGVRDVR